MISIIICSRNSFDLQKVLLNVETTIGVEFEPVVIDNSNGQYTIFEAYNLGINLSKGDLLCFMHEDIAFETQGWGKRVVEIFDSNLNLGLLGVAGSSYKPSVPSGWSFPEARTDTFYMNIVQHRKGSEPSCTIYINPRNEALSKVVSVDGVWFCTTREVVKDIKFDDITFNNFHCYDIDFSLSVLQKYDVAVTFEILIHHFSEGSFNDSWITETLKLHNKWNSILPINLDNISVETQEEEEFKAFHSILPRLIGKRELSLGVAKSLWLSKAPGLVGVKKFALMNLVLLKKAFDGAK